MISTHILDTTLGMPAKNVNVELAKHDGQHWVDIQISSTNDDGRIAFNCPNEKGVYRLKFKIEDYLKKNNFTPFFVVAPVVFEITDTARKYHVPLLLNPFGYSTYRGS
ncbi:MAG: Transthyretin family protein [Pseudobdellovibrio sp.]|jgi:5-hydroxyisourate hydrolase|nr:Transthyretin family protein [Pseudobdellovibrio sp.]